MSKCCPLTHTLTCIYTEYTHIHTGWHMYNNNSLVNLKENLAWGMRPLWEDLILSSDFVNFLSLFFEQVLGYPRLPSNSFCSWRLPWTWISCLNLSRARIIGVNSVYAVLSSKLRAMYMLGKYSVISPILLIFLFSWEKCLQGKLSSEHLLNLRPQEMACEKMFHALESKYLHINVQRAEGLNSAWL